MKTLRILLVLSILFLLYAFTANGQSRTNRIYGPCPGSTTPASVTVSSGDIVLTPCSGKAVIDSSNLINSHALRFDATKNSHVDHGAFWLPGVNYSTFHWDMLVRPMATSGTGYIISAGYGGAHNLLLGTSNSGGRFAVTGNIWNGSGVVTFSTPQKFFIGEWYHIAVVWDGTEIITYVNGVPEGRTAYAAATRSTPSGTDSVLYVGGSDHLMNTFDLAWIRGWEGTLPNIGASYAPYRTTRFPLAAHNPSGSTVVKAQFLADYTQVANVINDLSDGLSSVRHPGIRSRGAGVGIFLGTPTTPILLTTEADLPQWVPAIIEAPNVVEAVTVPPTAKVYDSFSNGDNSPFWSDADGLGSTEGGTAGIKTWSATASMYGINGGTVFAKTTSDNEYAIVETDTVTQDININREGRRMLIVGRYADFNNFVYCQPYDNSGLSAVECGRKVAGVFTSLFTGNVGAFNADLRMEISGTNLKFYMGGALVVNVTDASLPATGTKTGFRVSSQDLSKIDLFEVY